jgi:hypothetical protein
VESTGKISGTRIQLRGGAESMRLAKGKLVFEAKPPRHFTNKLVPANARPALVLFVLAATGFGSFGGLN